MGDDLPATRVTAVPHAKNQIVRFGVFEVDLRAGELRKGGVKIKLYAQPFEVLTMLLERPGEVVTREEIQQKLWAADTFVDFEHGLNKTINKLREALGDDADNPRFVETLPRRGYRFIGPVAELGPTVLPAPGKPAEKEEEAPPKRGKTGMWAIGLGVAAVVSGLVAGVLWFRSPPPVPRVLRYRQLTSDRLMKRESCFGYWSRLVSDGSRIFFAEIDSGIMQVSVNGGEATKVANPLPCFNIFDISPDKTELLGAQVKGYQPDQPLWALSTVSGMARRLGNLKGHAAASSPDGQSIAYATAAYVGEPPNDLYIAPKDGRDGKKVATIQGFIWDIRWSADGKFVRTAVTGTPFFVWEVSRDGTNLHPTHPWNLIPCGYGPVYSFNWSPDDRYLVFEASVSPSGTSWVLRDSRTGFRKHSGKATQLSSGALDLWDPVFSPDGKQIFAVGARARGELVRLDLHLQKIEPYLSGISAEHLAFSRDGVWVAYVTYPEGSLWRSRVDGSERMQLTEPPLRAVVPQWSPDGSRIAFSDGGRLFVISAQGGNPEAVAAVPNGLATDPSWMPDGNSLVFGGSVWASQTVLSSLDLRTGSISEIPGSENLFSPRVSPDGRYIAALSTQQDRIMLFDLKERSWSKLLDGTDAHWPNWSNDNRYIYFKTGSGKELALYRVSIADGKLEHLATPEVSEELVGVFGAWLGLRPDGSPLVLRDLSVQEIYALDVELP